MATKLKPTTVSSSVPSAEGFQFGIAVAEWNREVTEQLLAGAVEQLKAAGCYEEDILIKWVPGAYELSLAAQFFCEHTDVDAVVALGCIIKGDTPHFDFIAMGVTQGINQVALEYNTPVAFGVLTTNDLQQAVDRSGGKLGNKGAEAAETALRMVVLKEEFQEEEA